jgi:murein DD-endopeptidase MepM/ murein hydrolase activator NlpD
MRTPVLSVMAGTVFKTGEDKSYGKYVIVDHNNKYKSLYAQLDEITAVKGQYVARGETIALSGNTGMSTGPHLHFSIYFENQAIDPLSILVFTGNQ